MRSLRKLKGWRRPLHIQLGQLKDEAVALRRKVLEDARHVDRTGAPPAPEVPRPSPPPPRAPGLVRLTLVADAPSPLTLRELNAFLADLSTLCAASIDAALDDEGEETVHVLRVSYASPVEIVLAIPDAAAAAGALWLLVQAFDRVSNWRLNRELLRARIARERSGVDQALAAQQQEALERDRFTAAATRRLEASRLQVTDVRIDVHPRTPPADDEE